MKTTRALTDIRVVGAKLAYVSFRIDGVAHDLSSSGECRSTASLKLVELSANERAVLEPYRAQALAKALEYGPIYFPEPRD